MPRVAEAPPPRRPPFFWWILANALAICFAVTSWFVCLSIFSHPENPRNYKILAKLKRLPELKTYQLFDAPSAKSLSSTDLYRKFQGFDEDRFAKLNPALLRNYLTNFKQPTLLNYVEGSFKVQAVRPLGPEDLISPGFVVRAHAMVKPDEFSPPAPFPVILEYVFPTSHPAAFSWFKPHDLLTVTKVPNCAVILHITKVDQQDTDGSTEQVLCVTAMPIVYGEYRVGAERVFRLDPPRHINPDTQFPFFR